MYPNIMTKTDALLDNATSGLHTEPNHLGKLGDFQGRTSSCTDGSNPDNNLSVVGKQCSCNHSGAVTLSDRAIKAGVRSFIVRVP